MKTKKERNALKKEVETESKERQKLTEEELAQVSGGGHVIVPTMFGPTGSTNPYNRG